MIGQTLNAIAWKFRRSLQRLGIWKAGEEELLVRRLRQFGRNKEFPTQPFQFVFITGAAGSGTTLLTRILSSPPQAVSLGGNYMTVPETERTAYLMSRYFNKAITRLWDTEGPLEQYEQSKKIFRPLLTEMTSENFFENKTHWIYKRSAPFNVGNRNRPDLSDLLTIFEQVKFVIMYRHPCATTYSVLRRGYAKNLRASAVICEAQLTYLAAQLNTLDASLYQIVPYESFCLEPAFWVDKIAAFSDLSVQFFHKALQGEKVETGRNERWQQALGKHEKDFLVNFFDRRRMAQWSLMSDSELSL